MKRATTLFGLISILGLAPLPASAGLTLTTAQYDVACSPSTGSNPTGVCTGTMQAFRSHSDPKAYAQISVNSLGLASFTASLNGKSFVCAFPDTYDAQYLASFAGDLENSIFRVEEKGGVCTKIIVQRGSLWPKY